MDLHHDNLHINYKREKVVMKPTFTLLDMSNVL